MRIEEPPKSFKIGNCIVRPSELRIRNGETEHPVEAKVMDVLLVLTENAGHVVMREDLIDRVWGVEHGGDESLTRAISLLRKFVGDSKGQYEYISLLSRR